MKKLSLCFILGLLFVCITACVNVSIQNQEENLSTPITYIETEQLTPFPTISPPKGFKFYQDDSSKIALYIPQEWVVTGEINGEFAILQSYPEDKYVGGEARQPGDTKCDLIIQPLGTDVVEYNSRLKSDPMTIIHSEEPITLNSGEIGIRLETESLGRSKIMVTEINERVVSLICFGNLDPFDLIAYTLTSIQ